MSFRSVLIAALVAAPCAGSAATLDAYLQGGVVMGTAPGESSTFEYSPGPIETSSGSRQEEAVAASEIGSGLAQAVYVFSGERGTLALGVDTEVTGSRFFQNQLWTRGYANALVQMAMTETYFVSGTGRVTVGMEFTADWAAQSFGIAASAAYADAGTTGVGFNATTRLYESSPTGPGPGVGFVRNELIEAAFDIDAPVGGFIDFTWRIDGSATAGSGFGPAERAFVNARNTANIFVRTEGAVSATAQTTGFLSDPAFGQPDPDIGVVPLPASALLLLAGLGALGGLGRRAQGKRPALPLSADDATAAARSPW